MQESNIFIAKSTLFFFFFFLFIFFFLLGLINITTWARGLVMRLNENEMSVILCLRGWRSRFFVELNNSLDRSDGGAEHWPAIKCTFKVTSTVASCGAIQIFVLLIEFSDPLVCFLLTGYGDAGYQVCAPRLLFFLFFLEYL